MNLRNRLSVTLNLFQVWILFCAGFILASCGGAKVDEANSPPVALFSFPANAITAPAQIQFNASASSDNDGSIASYFWSFGDGATGNGQLVSHTYAVGGVYTVTLTVTDNLGARATVGQTVRITPRQNSAPSAVISANQRRGLLPLNVQLSASQSTDQDGQITSYLWTFEDGSTSTDMNTERNFYAAGDYAVSLTVTDNDGAQTQDEVVITALASDVRFSMSGIITALPYTDVDGDVNDPNANYFNNNGDMAGAAQPIGNPSMLNGFISDRPTGGVNDRFAFDSDSHDIYTVKLDAGDFVSLQVIDAASADVDLYLFDLDTSELVVASTGDGEYESVRAPIAGDYFVMVFAKLYFSKYILRVGDTSMVTGPRAVGLSADFEPDQAIVKMRPGNNLVSAKSTATSAQLTLSHREKGRPALAKLNRLNPQTRSVLQMKSQSSGFESRLAATNPTAFAKLETLRAISHLAQQPDIEYAEPNYRVKPFFVPTDPLYKYQWHYPAINLPQAWDITRGDPNVVVAVVDSGVYLAHPDLQGRLLPGYDFISATSISSDGDGIDSNPDDPGDGTGIGVSSWHGTHVSGTVAAVMGNDIGGVGVAPESWVMPLRVLGVGGGLDYDVMQAVRYAAGLSNDSGTLPEQPADIINLSLGSAGYSQATQDLYTEVYQKGIIVVASSGNEGTDEPLYPASYNGVFSVGATELSGKQAYYSNRGPYLDVAAPGGLSIADQNLDGYSDGVLSTSIVEETGAPKRSSYRFYQGTSMAAPHVAGVAALMKSVHPKLTAQEFESLLINGEITREAGDAGRDNYYGYGIIDAQLAVSAASELANGGSTAAIYADRISLAFNGSKLQEQLTISAIGNDTIGVSAFDADVPWLKIVAISTDMNGIGTFSVTADITGLADGFYSGAIIFTPTRGSALRIDVVLRVGQINPIGDAGHLYVLLMDSTGAAKDVRLVGPTNGQYLYEFSNIPVGDYYLAAGSDIDNDNLVCNSGESCGFFPSVNEFSLIRVDQNRPNTNFSAGLFEAVGTASADPTLQRLSRELP